MALYYAREKQKVGHQIFPFKRLIVTKETEGKNTMGKTRDPFKNIRDAKGIFHAKMGSIKERNSVDLTKQEILRRGGKNTQNCSKKIFTTKIITVV